MLTPAEKIVILEGNSKRPFGTDLNHSTHPPQSKQTDFHDVSAYDFLTANLHDLGMGSSDNGTMVPGDMAPDPPPDTNEDVMEETSLLAHATMTAPTSPGDLQHVLLNSMAKYSGKKPTNIKVTSNDWEITVNGKKYRQASMAAMMYIASAHCNKYTRSLVDCVDKVVLQVKMSESSTKLESRLTSKE